MNPSRYMAIIVDLDLRDAPHLCAALEALSVPHSGPHCGDYDQVAAEVIIQPNTERDLTNALTTVALETRRDRNLPQSPLPSPLTRRGN